jgi:2'-5' RNA ligase
LNTLPTTQQDVRRIFIGIPVDQQAQKQINVLLKPIKKLPVDIYWIPEPNRHLTLAFLGNVPVGRIRNLVGSFDKVYQRSGRFQFKLTMLNRFPGRMGRIIALVNDPDTTLQDVYQITLDLVQSNGLELDRKKFRPHVTLGKIRRAHQVKETINQPTDICLNVSNVRLYESTMTDSGVVYTSLKDAQLS